MTVTLRGVGVRYGGRVAVDAVSLSLPAGQVTAIVGANGSGKSSLLRALAGVIRHDGGIDGDRSRIGYMPQGDADRVALTAFEIVLLGRLRSLRFRVADDDLRAAEAAMRAFGIADLGPRPIATLSGGQRQLVLLAQVFAGEPRLLLLDEPTSALDIRHQVRVLAIVRDATRQRGMTTVVVLHDLNAAARYADRIALMHAGRLAADGPPNMVLIPDRLRTVFETEVAVLPGPDGRPVVVPLAVSPS